MVQIAGEVSEGGASGAWIGSSNTLVAGLSQGCAPIGPAHVATTAQKNVVMEIDGRPALEVFKEEIGEMLARNLERCRSEEHTSELQSLRHLVCRLLLEKKKKKP